MAARWPYCNQIGAGPPCSDRPAGRHVAVVEREGSAVTQRSDGGTRVVVYTRLGCPACAKAEDDVARICSELGQSWRAVDVDGVAALQAEYGDRVPVIEIDGREHGFWTVEEPRFRAALARAR
jgi:glutaredoxin